MTKAKVVTVVGARPQFVKAAALSPAFAATKRIEELLVHTGQHFDANMSDIFFQELSIPTPYANLGIGGGTHGQNTGRMIEAIESILINERPDCVLVFGDTDSTLAAAIAASKLGVKLAHVEAGLRSFRRSMPEEINRVLTDHVADILYAPSDVALKHLWGEGVSREKTVKSGDVMHDVVKRFMVLADARSNIMKVMSLVPGGYNLLTLHRKENTDDPVILQRLVKGLAASELPIVFPIHPRTEKRFAEFGVSLPGNVRLMKPVGYLDILKLQANANFVLTDSGGVQKEAYFLGRPCITLRDETEWVELVECGANVLAGSDESLLSDLLGRDARAPLISDVYGPGNSAELIATDLVARL